MLTASTEQSEDIICEGSAISCLERLLDLLKISLYSKSAANLEQLLSLLEIVASPLSLLPKEDQEIDQKEDRRHDSEINRALGQPKI